MTGRGNGPRENGTRAGATGKGTGENGSRAGVTVAQAQAQAQAQKRHGGAWEWNPRQLRLGRTTPGVDPFDHEQLDVFQVAADFADWADRIADEYGCGRADLLDQLRRASSSTCLNVAEGSGEFRPKEKARLYRIARRSATESAAIIELLQRRSVRLGKPVEHLDTARAMLLRLVRMLVRMIQATERRGNGP